MLAGIPKAPSRFNPISNFARAELRQRYVLGRMYSLGYLTEAEYKTATGAIRGAALYDNSPGGSYAVHGEYVAELARQLLFSVYQDNLYSRGINIYTTVQFEDQEAAYRSVRNGVLEYTRRAPYPGPEEQLDHARGRRVQPPPLALDELPGRRVRQVPRQRRPADRRGAVGQPTEIKVARSSRETIVVNDRKRHRHRGARAGRPRQGQGSASQRGSVVYLHKNDAGIWEVINYPAVQAAFVSMVPQDGAIRAMVGGFEFSRGNFNRVTQARRQPSSNIKPSSTPPRSSAAWPATQISDQPPFYLSAEQTGSKPWSPKNYGNEYEPMLTMRQALYKSKNMVSIRIMQAVGPQYAQDYLARFGFDKSRHPAVLPHGPGRGLGHAAATGGRVLGVRQRRLPRHALPDRPRHRQQRQGADADHAFRGGRRRAARAIDPRTAFVMDDLLRGVATSGTAARARRAQARRRGRQDGHHRQDPWTPGSRATYPPGRHLPGWARPTSPSRWARAKPAAAWRCRSGWATCRRSSGACPRKRPASRPDGLIVDNGEYYFTEFPPGRPWPSLGLGDAPQQPSSGSICGDLQAACWAGARRPPARRAAHHALGWNTAPRARKLAPRPGGLPRWRRRSAHSRTKAASALARGFRRRSATGLSCRRATAARVSSSALAVGAVVEAPLRAAPTAPAWGP